MARGFAEALGLFLLPFAVYAILVAAGAQSRLSGRYWSRGRVALLTVVGLAAVLVGLLLFGVLAPRRQGAYVPAHIEDGRLVPGSIQ